MSEPLQLACAARRDYLPHLAAMLHSALERGGCPLAIHLLHGGDLRRRDATRLRAMVRAGGGDIGFIAVGDARVAGLRTLDSLPASHWYRIFLPELLPAQPRVVYLDADAIVVDSLLPLWGTELDGDLIAAVTNVFQHDHVDHPHRLGLRDPRAYFNTGVMLLDLDRMRREAVTAELQAYALANGPKLAFPEQDAMNAVIGDRRVALHPRWNLMNSILLFASAEEVLGADAVAEARRHPAIRHFEGPGINKPWHLLCERDDRELYLAHRRQTPWRRLRPVGLTPANLIRRAARPRRRRLPAAASARTAARPPRSTPPR